ncbi:N-acyl homoserine lactonase family protein [Mesorhizobium shangrilense]|uniref:N-acyl homoserine lactonase family protein n=1 Tax=Mesorhizobium shangrilense TaxID=460060 RepID=A0ABV2DGN3_9HYPH
MFKKLHAFHCGFERFPNAIFDPFSSNPAGTRETPYFFYLVEHSSGLVLFDTGANPGLIEDIKAYLGPEAENWGIDVRPADDARALLRTVGVQPEDVHHVVLSHLHYDHAGAMTSFPNARYWIQSAEWEFARNPPVYQESIYIQSEFDVPVERIRFVNGHEDMFGDGSIHLVLTPGHTKGHQSMLVKGASRSYLLVADAAYEPDLEDITRLPAAALTWSPDAMIESRLSLRRIRDENGALVICTHDTAFRTSVKLAPGAYYD